MHAAEIAVLLLGRTDGDAQRPALFGCVGGCTDLLLDHGRYGTVHDAAVAARADRLLKGESGQTRRAAEGYLGDFASESRIRTILDGTCSGDEIQEDALSLLLLGGAGALDQVLDRLTTDLPPAVAQALYRFATQQGAELWSTVIESRAARGWAALRPTFPFLCDVQADVGIPLLRRLLTHESSRVRRQTLGCLCRVDTRTPPERYLRDALEDKSFRVVAAALRRLARLGNPAALDLLCGTVAGEFKGASATLEAHRLSSELLLSLGDAGHERLCELLGSLCASPRPQNARRARAVAQILESRPGNARVGKALRSWRLSPGWWVSRVLRTE